MKFSDKSQAQFDQLIGDKGFGKSAYGAVTAGDATFHSGWTLHCVPANPSTLMREAMTIIYYPDGTHVGPADHKNREDDLNRWLPGLRPGELAASPLNPVLYTRN